MISKSHLIFCGLIASSPGLALVVSRDSVNRMLNAAALVADVEIVSRETLPHPTYIQVTESHARVDRVVRVIDDGGWFPDPGNEMIIETLGGESQGIGMILSGYPHPYSGFHYRAYLNRVTGHTFKPTGFESGLQILGQTRVYTRNRTDGSNGEGSGPFLFWDRTYFPIPYFISAPTFKNLPDFAAAVDASFQTWRAPPDVRLEYVAMGCTSVIRNANDGLNNVILVGDNWPFDPDAIAITRNFYVADNSDRAGLILDSDIMLNGVDHEFSTTGDPTKHDVQNIVTHEAGHFIGLGHDPDDPNATMYAVAIPGETIKRTLKDDDLAGLHAGYAGVGPKLGTTQTSSQCSLQNDNVGCLAVHQRRARPELMALLVFSVGLAFGLGRAVVGRPH